MNPLLIVLVALCESVGVGLVGMVVLRILRLHPVGHSLVAVIVITVCAMNASTLTVVLATRSLRLPVAADLAINLVAGIVSIGIGLLLGRSVMRGGRMLADATRSFGVDQRFRAPDDPPTAELAELARELASTSDKLAESRRREQAAETSRRRLVAWISHDLRSPLARLRILAESLEDGVADDIQGSCRKIRADTERLTGMVDDLFELSRIQAGTLRLRPREVALDDLISDEVAGLEVLAADRGVRLRAGTIQPVTVHVDDRAITRVLNNLLGNALRYTPPGTVVSIDVRAVDGWAVVSVADQCGGIPEQELASVFEMGWRGTRATGAERGGGLGLSIALGIVQAHQGHLTVRNVPGGCCFEVALPLVVT